MDQQQKEQVQYLLMRWLEVRTTPKEEALLFHLLNQENNNQYWEELMEELVASQPAQENYNRQQWQPVIESITRSKAPVRRLPGFAKIAAAASIILALGTAVYFLINKKETVSTTTAATQQKDFAPGSDKAILTLADGRQVVLTDVANGAIASQGDVKIIKLDGQISYQQATGSQQPVVYNTITTPPTGKYFLILAEGTKVWLDAATSFTYPTSFSGKERKVQLKGQAYFEVAHNPSMPFHVNSGGMDVTVLGTRFNIMAYDDEPSVKTTLLEGSVRVTSGTKNQLLLPGQQAHVKDGSIELVKDADVAQAVAWKSGLFQYKKSDIETILRQAARWYGVEVEYRGKITDKFSGQISRSVNLSQLLKILEETGRVRFEVGDKKLVVFPVS